MVDYDDLDQNLKRKEELVKKSLLSGAKNYIVKPLDRTKVLERINASVKRDS